MVAKALRATAERGSHGLVSRHEQEVTCLTHRPTTSAGDGSPPQDYVGDKRDVTNPFSAPYFRVQVFAAGVPPAPTEWQLQPNSMRSS
jgi:hypothetical protein